MFKILNRKKLISILFLFIFIRVIASVGQEVLLHRNRSSFYPPVPSAPAKYHSCDGGYDQYNSVCRIADNS